MKNLRDAKIKDAAKGMMIFLALGVIATGCSNKDKVADKEVVVQTSEVTEAVARDAGATYFVEVKFNEGSRQLTPESRQAIASMLQKASNDGVLIDEVKVMTWADQEYPSQSQKKLSKAQRKLADDRNKAISNYIDNYKHTVDVDTYNMAERPTAFSKMLNTNDARLKRSLVAAGLPTSPTDPNIFEGKSSHAVIMALVDTPSITDREIDPKSTRAPIAPETSTGSATEPAAE